MRLLLLTACLTSAAVQAQSACEAKCHQSASECLKGCAGDPKDAQKPEQQGRLLKCLDACEQRTQACKAACPRRDGPKGPVAPR